MVFQETANNQIAGDYNHQIEAIKIKLKDCPASMSIRYQVRVQDKGWTDWVGQDDAAGTTRQDKRLEAIRIQLLNPPRGWKIKYRVNVEGIGWQNWIYNNGAEVPNTEYAGTVGKSRKILAIQMQLTH